MDEQNKLPEINGQEEAQTPSEMKKQPYIEEGSTIFGGTGIEKKPMKNKSAGKRRTTRIIMLTAVAILLIAGCVLVAIYIPPLVTGDDSSDASSSENTMLIAKNRDNVKTIKITGAEGSFTVERAKAPASSDSSESDDQPEFKVLGFSSAIKINNYSMDAFVDACVGLNYTTKAETVNTEIELARYKLDKPTLTVTVVMDDGSSYTVYFSVEAPSRTGYYCYTSITSGIYIVESSVYSSFAIKSTSLMDLELIAAPVDTSTEEKEDEYFTADSYGGKSLSRIDEFSLSGSKIVKPYTLLYKTTDAIYTAPYIIKGDTSGRPLDSDKITRITSTLSYVFSALDVYSTTKDTAALKKYNLSNPEYIMSYKIKGVTHIMKMSAAPGDDAKDYLAVIVDDKPFIYKLSRTSVELIDYTASSYYSPLIFIADIKTVKSISITVDGKLTKFELTHSGEDNNDLTVKSGDVTLSTESDVDNFRSLYSEIIGLSPITESEKDYSGSPYVTMIFEYNNGKKSDKIELIKAESLRYLHRLNGSGTALITAEKVDKFVDDIEKVLTGKAITV